MPVDVTKTLQVALGKLQSERQRIDRQIAAIETVLNSTGPLRRRGGRRGRGRSAGRGRRRMSAAARKAIGQRMRAYWAKRKETAGKSGRNRK